MLAMTVLSIIYVSAALEEGQVADEFRNPKGFYMSVFLAFVVPLFTFLGTSLVWSKISPKTKFSLIPILGGLIPILFAMPFSMVID